MTFSTTFLELYHKYTGNQFPAPCPVETVRKELELLVEKGNEIIQNKIGISYSVSDIVITAEENNQIYEVNQLYSEFMDFFFN